MTTPPTATVIRTIQEKKTVECDQADIEWAFAQFPFEEEWATVSTSSPVPDPPKVNTKRFQKIAVRDFTIANDTDIITDTAILDWLGEDTLRVGELQTHMRYRGLTAREAYHHATKARSPLTATDYHGNPTTFTPGMKVMHCTDDGQLYPGTVKSIADDLLEITWPDGEEGWEKPNTCYPG